MQRKTTDTILDDFEHMDARGGLKEHDLLKKKEKLWKDLLDHILKGHSTWRQTERERLEA